LVDRAVSRPLSAVTHTYRREPGPIVVSLK